MRSASGDSSPVLPWLLIRQDGHGNRYRVGSYATRVEAEQIADRLGRRAGSGQRAGSGSGSGAGGDTDSYLVESRAPEGADRG
ncbi:SPOR domain-containing protein [Streptomyces armeniacus]|uniref:SPOR domain-containing protein n=1 Tax=Streptomyces armeniacus TaxID=83291 RepID=A0A345XQP2_9ACTN|nr:SPOR domain-containing protein [Streptomyces armeniacus]AXK33958.1 SPOR domain-containing protein [Streptomyces armeniacus]